MFRSLLTRSLLGIFLLGTLAGCKHNARSLPPDGEKKSNIELILQFQESTVNCKGPMSKQHVVFLRGPAGRRWASIPSEWLPEFDNSITVEAWIETNRASGEGMQSLISKWKPLEAFDDFSAYDTGMTCGLDTKGFLGAIFDGRYVYFPPQMNTSERHGNVLRYDSHKQFRDSSAWTAYDASDTAGLDTRGYYGAAFDGQYVYFVPRFDGKHLHSRVLRLDTTRSFIDPASWDAHDAGLAVSYQGVAFDGRFLYFAPGYAGKNDSSGLILRHDTHGGFHEQDSWTTYDAENTDKLPTAGFDGAAFDGEYVYFVPLNNGVVLRYDTRSPFAQSDGWLAFDVRPLGVKRCVGSVFDGRYLYLVPYGDTKVVTRLDTRADFHDRESWKTFDTSTVGKQLTIGYDGGIYDGRYVYLIPFMFKNHQYHCNFLRYDTQKPFSDISSWSTYDASQVDGLKTVGYNGGAFDGRYIYCAPWQDGEAYPKAVIGHGRVLRCDTLGNQGSFSLRFADYGHNGGLSASLPGPSFLVNTENGVRSVAAHKSIPPGRHHLAGTYDGQCIRLFADGILVAERETSGRILNNSVDVAIGRISKGSAYFNGIFHEVRISNRAKSPAQIQVEASRTARFEVCE